MAGFIFTRGAMALCSGAVDWDTDTIKARLSRTAEVVASTATTMTGLGLPATDTELVQKTGPTEDLVHGRVQFSAGNPTFFSVAAGPEINKLILFKAGPTDADAIPLAVVDIGPRTPDGTHIAVIVGTAGLFYLQQ